MNQDDAFEDDENYPDDLPEASPEELDRQEEEAAAIIMEEQELEKQIQPVGFIPASNAEELAKALFASGGHEKQIDRVNEIIAGAQSRENAVEAYKEVLRFLKDNRPCRFFIPNVGQEKAILPLKTVPADEADVLIGAFVAANMVGKTTILCGPLSVGCIWGRSELSEFFADWNIFEKFENVRKEERRPLRFRIICHAGGMEDGGQVFEELTKWWPKGLYKWEKNHKSYYSVVKCWDHEGNLLAVGNVRTHDQPRNAHAGHTLDFTLCDEPMPANLWNENVARLRTRMGGLIWLFLTPLDDGAWIKDKLAEDNSIFFTQASIWDNCRDYHPDPRMWSGGKVGEGKLLTRGILARKVIDKNIREWMKDGVEAMEARVNGAFTHMSGTVLKEFDPGFHIVEPFPIPKHWPIYFGVDPHDGKPHFAFWVAQSPDGRFFVIDEFPFDKWGSVSGGISIPSACDHFREIEAPFRQQVIYRVGDPKKLAASVSGRTQTSQQAEFAAEGFVIELGNNNVQVGTSRIRELLLHEKGVPGGRPHLAFFRSSWATGRPLVNACSFATNLCYKAGYGSSSSDKDLGSMMQDKWKDPFDCLRYIIMRVVAFVPVGSMRQKLKSAITRPRINRSARPWQ